MHRNTEEKTENNSLILPFSCISAIPLKSFDILTFLKFSNEVFSPWEDIYGSVVHHLVASGS